jgi:PAS domain S-box-containing protein
MEKRYLGKDGATAWVELSESLIRQNEGRPANFIPVADDSTPRMQAEMLLAKKDSNG